jgi:hypothetical protein
MVPQIFQFESDYPTGSPFWARVRIWPTAHAKDMYEEGEVFEIGEPVWLSRSSLVQPQDHVYWICGFDYDHGVAKLTWGPPEVSPRGVATIPVRPWHLLKLPDMVRIAAEASRP